MAQLRRLAVLVLLLSGCSGDAPRNVLLISIDTLRADHLGCYGFEKDTTPHIDALAREGVRFENVVSPVPLTLPAHASLLTGTIPPVHGVHDNLSHRLSDSATTLAELFRREGLVTGAVVSSFVLDSQFNLSQGFDSYNDEFEEEHKIAFLSERKGAETTRMARAWLDAHGGEPFFLFLHYYDPHDGYEPPEPFDARFPGDPYSGEVAFVDQQVGEVLAKLRELGLDDDTVVALTSDHGEMLEEHGELTHGYFVYQSALRVPLVLRAPGVAPRVVSEAVGLVDVAPTLASLLGLRFPSEIEGRDLSPLVKGEEVSLGRRELYVESVTPNRYYGLNPLIGIVTDRFKYIDTTRPELYDLVEDPGETTNILEREARIAAGMKERIASISRAASASPASRLDEESLRRLSSLGYLSSGGSGAGNVAVEPDRGDPKDWISFYRDHQQLEKLVEERRYDAARSLAESMLARKPDFTVGYLQLALIATETGKPEVAREHYLRALAIDSDDRIAHYHLAETLTRLGESSAAVEHYRKAVELDPDFVEAREGLARALLENGDTQAAMAALGDSGTAEAHVLKGSAFATRSSWEEAVAEFRSALAIDAENGEAHFQLGTVLASQGKLDEAIAHYRRALSTAPKPAEAHHRLGLALREQGQTGEALRHLEKAVELDPGLAPAHVNLGLTLKQLGRPDEALEHYRKALALDPALAPAHNNIGSVLGSRGQIRESIRYFRRALEIDPGYDDAHNNLALALRMTGQREEAISHFRAALKLRPDWPEPMNELAWILATHPDASVRNPQEALRLAERAAELSGRGQPVVLDTLAAAYAANGSFDRAVTAGEEAAAAAAATAPELAREIRSRVALYRKGTAFREAR